MHNHTPMPRHTHTHLQTHNVHCLDQQTKIIFCISFIFVWFFCRFAGHCLCVGIRDVTATAKRRRKSVLYSLCMNSFYTHTYTMEVKAANNRDTHILIGSLSQYNANTCTVYSVQPPPH